MLQCCAHYRASDSRSSQPGRLNLKPELPKPSFLERKLPTSSLLKRRLRPLSFRSLNSRLLNLDLKPLKLSSLALAVALAAPCACLSGITGAQPTVLAEERGDLALVPYFPMNVAFSIQHCDSGLPVRVSASRSRATYSCIPRATGKKVFYGGMWRFSKSKTGKLEQIYRRSESPISPLALCGRLSAKPW